MKKQTQKIYGEGRCKNCWEVFPKKTSWQVFCTPKCHDEFHGGKQKNTRAIIQRVQILEDQLKTMDAGMRALAAFIVEARNAIAIKKIDEHTKEGK